MPHDELVKLGEDIKQNGLLSPIVVMEKGSDTADATYSLLDGKNRLTAMELVGVEFDLGFIEYRGQRLRPYLNVPGRHKQGWSAIEIIGGPEAGAKRRARSLNEYRRHMSADDKRRAIEDLLKLDPTKSDRQIADEAKSNRTTVGQVRAKLEESGDVSIVDTRKDTKGRKQPAKKAKAAKDVTEAEAIAKFQGQRGRV